MIKLTLAARENSTNKLADKGAQISCCAACMSLCVFKALALLRPELCSTWVLKILGWGEYGWGSDGLARLPHACSARAGLAKNPKIHENHQICPIPQLWPIFLCFFFSCWPSCLWPLASCMISACTLLDLCLLSAWSLLDLCFISACSLLGLCLISASCLLALCFVSAWSLLALCLLYDQPGHFRFHFLEWADTYRLHCMQESRLSVSVHVTKYRKI